MLQVSFKSDNQPGQRMFSTFKNSNEIWNQEDKRMFSIVRAAIKPGFSLVIGCFQHSVFSSRISWPEVR